MSTRTKEKEEKILHVLDALIEESSKGIPIIVEGKKDVTALLALGVKGKVITLKTGGKSFLNFLSEIEKMDLPEVILLLDFDRRGKEGMKRLTLNLERTKTKPNFKFWRKLKTLMGKEIQCIESLTTYIENLHSKTST